MSRAKVQPGVIVFDFRPLVAAYCRVIDDVLDLFNPTRARAKRLRVQRATHGGNGTDARLYPDGWQSWACAAFLHDECPSDEHDLGCTCTARRCHKRKDR